MNRKKLNIIAPVFKDLKNVVRWEIDEKDVLWVWTSRQLLSAKKIHGTYGNVTSHV